MIEVHTLQYLFFSSKTQKCVNGDQIGIRSIVSYVYTLFKNKYILLHIKVKHSNINICATTVHLEKSNGGTTLEESYYKKYSDKKIKKKILTCCYCSSCGNFWRKCFYFPFVLQFLPYLFVYGLELSKVMCKDVHISDLYTSSQKAPNVRI